MKTKTHPWIYSCLVILTAFVGLSPVGVSPGNVSPPAQDFSRAELENEFPGLAPALEKLDCRAAEITGGVRNVLPSYCLLYEDAFLLPVFGQRLGKALIRDCGHPEALLHHTFMVLGAPAGGWGPPLTGLDELARITEDPVEQEQVIKDLAKHYGFRFEGGTRRDWDLLPPAVRSGILEAIRGLMETGKIARQFTAPLNEFIHERGIRYHDDIEAKLLEPWRKRQLDTLWMADLAGEADLRKLSFASRLMAGQLYRLLSLDASSVGPGFGSCVIGTEMGRIGIFGRGRDTINGSFLLVVDLGGDDHYMGSPASPIPGERLLSGVVDLGGNDTYDGREGTLVTGCLGIGMLMDLSGHDLYLSGGNGIASACYGVALLYDLEGNDCYFSGGACSQGAAHAGVAILADMDGDDRYRAKDHSQGYAGTGGLGLLLDIRGCDRYNTPGDTPSFVQGSGRGRWAEATDGHSLGGGFGILVDSDGSDEYYAGSFSQGAGYFMGAGIFMDAGGDDRYDAVSHSQGYAAHFALAAFFDKTGNDLYNSGVDSLKITQIMGGGRDLSFGCLIEGSGDDRYYFGNRSAGIGDLEGIGIFWDRSGRDGFTWHRNQLNKDSPSMGKTIGPANGMGIGLRLFSDPSKSPTGVFRNDD